MESIKTFKDLEFVIHPILLDAKSSQVTKEVFGNSKNAVMEFENGYGVSVILGEQFYSNGIDNYEVAVLKNGIICHKTYITDNVVGYQTENEVTEIMRKVQELNK